MEDLLPSLEHLELDVIWSAAIVKCGRKFPTFSVISVSGTLNSEFRGTVNAFLLFFSLNSTSILTAFHPPLTASGTTTFFSTGGVPGSPCGAPGMPG